MSDEYFERAKQHASAALEKSREVAREIAATKGRAPTAEEYANTAALQALIVAFTGAEKRRELEKRIAQLEELTLELVK